MGRRGEAPPVIMDPWLVFVILCEQQQITVSNSKWCPLVLQLLCNPRVLVKVGLQEVLKGDN
jgi:hypothetical protein